MTVKSRLRALAVALLAGTACVSAAIPASIVAGAFSPAQAQVSAEFQQALESYGSWQRHPRWGEVWVPEDVPRGWRPYEYGHWVYTDEWGWYWVSDESEADWGWVTFHYGRWAFEPRRGWFWIPGDEWAPAWVDWRYSDDYVGWAPLPPDDIEVEYEAQPTYWFFVSPRYLTAPHWRTHAALSQRRSAIFRSSRVVNRTVVFQSRDRAAVNPGISPAFIASTTHRPVQSYRVSPHVLANTRGVSGAVTVRTEDLRKGGRGGRNRGAVTHVSVQKTDVVIKPEAKPQAPQALGKGEKGRLGSRPPKAAQGAAPATTQPAPSAPAKPNAAPAAPAPAAKPAPAPQSAPAPAPRAVTPNTPPKPEPQSRPQQRQEQRPPQPSPAQPKPPAAEKPATPPPSPQKPATPPAPPKPATPPPAAHPAPAAAPPPAKPPGPPPQHTAPPPQAPKPPPPAAKPAPQPAPAKPEEKKPEEKK